jgi:hypothetical protein
LWKYRPADHDVRGFFIGGPTMLTNWDIVARLMSISLMASYVAEIADALGKMERDEYRARQQASNERLVRSVLHNERRRNRRKAA